MKPQFYSRFIHPTGPQRSRWLGLAVAGLLSMAVFPSFGEEPVAKTKTDFEANIDRVYEGDHLADIRVTFGYDNWKDFEDPNDPGRARNLMAWLLDKSFVQVICTPEWAKELGVSSDTKNLRVFEGQGNGDERLRVSIIWSAATSSTAKNIGGGYTKQLKCSNEALKFMQASSESADASIYVGHSRDGGGPDTFPPQTVLGDSEDRQKVDFSFYRREKPGLAALRGHFAKTKGKPCFIAWTGCLSDRFLGWITDQLGTRETPASLILSSRLSRSMPWVDGFEGVDEALMLVTRLIDAIRLHHSQKTFEKGMFESELSDMREPDRPEWHLYSAPSHRDTSPRKAK